MNLSKPCAFCGKTYNKIESVYILMADLGEIQEFIGVFDNKDDALKYSLNKEYVKEAYYVLEQDINYPYTQSIV